MTNSTAIIFESKYGTTAKVAQIIASAMTVPSPDIINLRTDTLPRPIEDYDLIILGTSIYGRKPLSAIRAFSEKNAEILLNKQLAIFVCGMIPSEEQQMQELSAAFPTALGQHACAQAFVGGEFDFSRMNFFERMVVKYIAKTNQNTSAIQTERIELFADQINRSTSPARGSISRS